MTPLEDANRHAISLASSAVAWIENGATDTDVRAALISAWRDLGSPVGAFAAAATAVALIRQPLDSPPESLEEEVRLREALGLPSTSEQLVALISARTALEDLAHEFD